MSDSIFAGLLDNNWHRVGFAALLALHMLSFSYNKKKHMPRHNLVAMNKILGEASLSEKIKLGNKH